MNKIIFLLIAGQYSLSAMAQTNTPPSFATDRDMSRWAIDLNIMGGGFSQTRGTALQPNYLNGINVTPGTAKFKNGRALGGDIQLGYFFDKNKHWGIGTGVLYLREWGNATLENFHAEYQSVDNNGSIFRQVVSANRITDRVKADNFNIPLVLKYKNRFSERWGFTADAGVLFNLQMKNSYRTDATFDYEAIYKFVTNEGGARAVYETEAIPADGDFLITRSHFSKNNPNGSVADYFAAKRAAGYNVGLGVNPDKKEGTVSYAPRSVGLLLQPSVNYFFSDNVALNLGAYYIYQPFKSKESGPYAMTGKPGEYNSFIGSAAKMQTQSYGGNVGLRFFLGRKSVPVNITHVNQYAPSICGSCDGSFALHGLKPGAKATVSYTVNGAGTPNTYAGTANNEGTVTVPDLCAGSYTGIKTTVGKRTANSNSSTVSLADPEFAISRVESVSPTSAGKCDGTISLYGLSAGQKATVTYMMNGEKNTYTNTVSPDNSIKLSGLCEGTFTSMTVESNKCIAKLTNPGSIVLTNPKPTIIPVDEEEITESQILFDFNTSDIRPASYATINRVYEQLQKDNESYVVIEGNTDRIGTDEYNQKLSERRAAAVRAYLMNKGISSARIRTHGKGEREPVAPNSTTEGRSKNRRAELLIKIGK